MSAKKHAKPSAGAIRQRRFVAKKYAEGRCPYCGAKKRTAKAKAAGA